MMYRLTMRTTLSVDDDVLLAVREIADAHGVPLGTAVSDLLRRALRPTPRVTTGEDGLPVITVSDEARPITGEDVARALAEP